MDLSGDFVDTSGDWGGFFGSTFGERSEGRLGKEEGTIGGGGEGC